jgi:hypothetical protein
MTRITDPDSNAGERFGVVAQAGTASHANLFSGRKFRVDHPHARLRARRSAPRASRRRHGRANSVVEKRLCHADFARHLRRSSDPAVARRCVAREHAAERGGDARRVAGAPAAVHSLLSGVAFFSLCCSNRNPVHVDSRCVLIRHLSWLGVQNGEEGKTEGEAGSEEDCQEDHRQEEGSGEEEVVTRRTRRLAFTNAKRSVVGADEVEDRPPSGCCRAPRRQCRRQRASARRGSGAESPVSRRRWDQGLVER